MTTSVPERLQPLAGPSTAVATTGITNENCDPDVQIAIWTESTMASGNKNSDITADLVNASELTSTPKTQQPGSSRSPLSESLQPLILSGKRLSKIKLMMDLRKEGFNIGKFQTLSVLPALVSGKRMSDEWLQCTNENCSIWCLWKMWQCIYLCFVPDMFYVTTCHLSKLLYSFQYYLIYILEIVLYFETHLPSYSWSILIYIMMHIKIVWWLF